MPIIVSGFSEFLAENVQTMTKEMPWMKDRDLRLCKTVEELAKFVDEAILAGKCVVDIETTGLNTRKRQGKPVERLVGFCLAYTSKVGLYVPVGHQEGAEDNLPLEWVLEQIRRLTSLCVTIYHNAKYDLVFMANWGVVVRDWQKIEDTLLLARLHDAGSKDIRLKHLSDKLLHQPMIEFSDVAGKNKRFDLIPPKIAYIYGASDAVCTFDLYTFYMSQEIALKQRPVYNLEKRVLFVVMEMESNLVFIDTQFLMAMKQEMEQKVVVIRKQIFDLAGREFNLGSTIQLGKVLFEELHYPLPEGARTKSGQYSTDTKTLEKLSKDFPVVKKIIEFREAEKVLSTYIYNLLVNHDENDCIKLAFNQVGTDTGRFSSPGGDGIEADGYCGINVQSLPKGDIRKAFRARPGFKLVAMDYSNEEMRVAANLSKEGVWIDGFSNNEDLHIKTAELIYNKKVGKDDPERAAAKCVARGTLIATDRGCIPIEQIRPGDHVISHTGKLRKVSRVWGMGTKPGVTIETTGGHKLTCGLNHRFLTDSNTWVRGEDLEIDQVIQTAFCAKAIPESAPCVQFNHTRVKSVARLDTVELMDLTVEIDHTYIAQGLVTHNTLNFATLYGGGANRISETTGISIGEAKKVQSTFFSRLPVLKKWIDTEIRRARKSKQVVTAFGRIRPLDIYYNSEDRGMQAHGDRCVANTLIQSGCADIMKTAMVRLYNWIHDNNHQDNVRMLITMHDEIVFEIREDMLEKYVPILHQIMVLSDILQERLRWPVALKMDAEYGDSWHADHDFFKEHPDALEHTATYLFQQTNQVSGRFAVLTQTDQTSAPASVQVEVATPAAPQQIVEPTVAPPSMARSDGDSTAAPQNPSGSFELDISDLVPVATPVPQSTESATSSYTPPVTSQGDEGEFVYRLRDTRKSTLRIVNAILTFLQGENKEEIAYSGTVKTLTLLDSEGYSLLISDVKVSPDAFLSLARYLGI